MSDKSKDVHRFLFMVGLVVAGEAVFALPFHVARFFRPTVLEVFALTNTELGAAQGIYGILAMIAYFPGGPLADRFSARKLLAFSLWMTAAGGLYMATFPGYRGALFLWGFFGVSTILLFWAALIRATRDWGGNDQQGRAYGLLDGGRGLLAAVLASIAVVVFGFFFPEDYSSATFEEKKEALRVVIHGYAAATALAGLFVWFVISDRHPKREEGLEDREPQTGTVWVHFMRVMRIPAVWLQALIVVCAYVGYKGFDNYSLYAVEGYGMNEVDAARLVAIGAWMRPVAALGAGFLGDRFTISRMTLMAFVLLLISDLFFALTTPLPGIVWVLFCNMLLGASAIFGLRGLYFALFQEAKVPVAVTGTAVGLVSVLGFTPDIFVAYIGGVLLDRSPGLAGHQHFFLFLAAFAALGVIASYTIMRMLHKKV
ncbi:MAG: MFS transporter [Gammaproteobacteria bacterium]|nr:MFS transporter [Gammaproteobacteria bacterium]MCZ6762853.1 MFS transporter [Gammaproteobacteria bacterium]